VKYTVNSRNYALDLPLNEWNSFSESKNAKSITGPLLADLFFRVLGYAPWKSFNLLPATAFDSVSNNQKLVSFCPLLLIHFSGMIVEYYSTPFWWISFIYLWHTIWMNFIQHNRNTPCQIVSCFCPFIFINRLVYGFEPIKLNTFQVLDSGGHFGSKYWTIFIVS
jgi:hypothetical protein